ncbi:hypothetical protein Theam_1792 (plasmid) [Thermovibrio ammonificans HB-1]|uniref:Type IV pilus biogenesis protein PilP n=1 Tax=Thermovibrio ammonificans (strain DSM 15698 / JCM 12110 / HB-1) TaxID=648996 RepID=E8T6S5_THEA1|nr:hypothetical protein [Thermovibrio ammonificans]ADU97748.1 hypothetical protein Theam_1792 [Thermovibrio ammonificans HB-1]
MKGKVIAVALLAANTALGATIAPTPPVPKGTPVKVKKQEQAVHRQRPVPARRNEKQVVLPAPEFLYKPPEVDKFEKEREELLRQKDLLQIKVDIARLKAELQKYQLAPVELKLKLEKSAGIRQAPQARVTAPATATRVNPQLELQKEYLRMQMERERLQNLERKLSLLQNLFTGVMSVGGQKVAFDSMGRKYTVGSTVYGCRIVDILNDGVVVAYDGHVFKVPISASTPEKSKKTSQSQIASGPSAQPAPPQVPPAPVPPPPPMEVPPVPVQ